ncbi:hypothetical protein RchiOBHm_Chr2g0113431 [Rosa chinensis]|uniref:Uncharacterized protein n=1 Tax=Rosa chinensis TaxID=74649 RepID=A0A2P6RQG8_ROSCH|nr:hypothetical protein RchiOBHm_Chr2g0113431 [Rosa chinensis]
MAIGGIYNHPIQDSPPTSSKVEETLEEDLDDREKHLENTKESSFPSSVFLVLPKAPRLLRASEANLLKSHSKSIPEKVLHA